MHVNGRILDSAFTLTWEPTYDKLVEAVKAATDTGVRVCATDGDICHMSANLIICRKLESMSDLETLAQLSKRRWSHMKSK